MADKKKGEQMKLKNSIEVKDFLAAVDKCSGSVYLLSYQGDRLNLKSVMSRYISMGKLLSDEGDNLELFCDKREDEQYFFSFFNTYPDAV